MTRRRPASGVVEAVCVVERVRPGHHHPTAIDKRPRRGRVAVGELGLDGDRQVDTSHGGVDAAVYVFSDEDAALWADRLPSGTAPGTFGENLRVSGLDVSGALIGQRWRVGSVVLEVCKPRTPCRNLSAHVGVEGFHLELAATGRVGAMCAVVQPGELAAGDAIVAAPPPDHAVTVERYVTGFDADAAQRLLDAGITLARPVRAKARRALARTGAHG
ncbi:MOSC domain-containing protein [Terracoccus luteus]|uniref:MOSC domain-containing protein YiiM n=1 Tax=Terracoccus luteus TaxID=53356 RepID=A0A495Y194_9MICO|nr:MOSC domain-containing protein [Terracoccus luteus]MBB2986629.1 MOSC domain-containing protein YiiM [Terracoccus luteus]MCP2171782.1 MOSC domain-containing protein YiiM [Terracoccus luteus]RKT79379.1 MOSC domain-containing protein YiiM [Terracoccus luteus]